MKVNPKRAKGEKKAAIRGCSREEINSTTKKRGEKKEPQGGVNRREAEGKAQGKGHAKGNGTI